MFVLLRCAAEAFERAGQRKKGKGKEAACSSSGVERVEGEWDSEEEAYVVKKPVKKKPAKPRAPKGKAAAAAAAAVVEDGGVKRTAEQAFAGTSPCATQPQPATMDVTAPATGEEPFVPAAAAAAAAFASGGLDDDYDEESD